MKRVFAALLALTLVLAFAGCAAVEEGPKNANQYLTVEGLYVDTTYESDDGKILLYAAINVNAADKNLEVDAKYTPINIGENNYESEFYKGTCKYMPNYYYSSFIEEVPIGTQLKWALTWEVYEADLEAGKTITFGDSMFNGIELVTDDVVTCEGIEAVGLLADPAGSAEIVEKSAPADEDTVKKVRNAINGYYFKFQVTVGTSLIEYELEFSSPNNFEVRSMGISNGGTYDVRNGYIYCTYPTNGHTIEVPYSFDASGEIGLNCSAAFSIYE